MKSPKPAPKDKPKINADKPTPARRARKPALTKAGKPRVNAPGQGRPFLEESRCKNLPRVTAAVHAKLQAIAALKECSLADAVEIAVDDLHRRSKLPAVE